MIIIATYNDAAEAYAAKDLLESNGIHCELHGDLLDEIETMGNIELCVDAQSAPLAEEVLANAHNQE